MKKAAIFDFDGPIEERTISKCHELNKVTNPDLTWENFQKMSHGNFYESFADFNFVPNPDFQKEYRKFLDTLEIEKIIRDTIIDLAYTHELAVVSSGSEVAIKEFLRKNNVLHLFSDVLGFETDKSKIIKIEKLHKKFSAKKEKMVFVTDSLGDILEAHEAGVRSIGITWGLHDKATLEQGIPYSIITRKDELLHAIKMATWNYHPQHY